MPETYSSPHCVEVCTYQSALFSSTQHSQEEENASGPDTAGSEPEYQLVLVSTTPTVKKKHWMWKIILSSKEKTSSKKEKEEEVGELGGRGRSDGQDRTHLIPVTE